MADSWKILVVDDDEIVARTTADFLTRIDDDGNEGTRAVAESSFEKSLPLLREGNVDILVLDVRDQGMHSKGISGDENADFGIDIFQEIRSRKFLPIIFYTALPHLVTSLSNPPFVQIVSKGERSDIDDLGDSEDRLRVAVEQVFDSGLPRLLRAIGRHIETSTKEFMVDFIEKNWSYIDNSKADFAYLLARRLIVSLEARADAFADELGYSTGLDSAKGVHATRYYIVPLTEDHHRMGDIIRGLQNIDGDVDSLYIILTPSCDLVEDRVKADNVVLAECVPLQDFQEYKNWIKRDTGAARKKLLNLLRSRPDKGQEDRYHYLPAAWQTPDLIVDLQRIKYISYGRLEKCTKMASLDSPFSEALANRFNRYIGRVGTPDLDFDAALDRMREAD